MADVNLGNFLNNIINSTSAVSWLSSGKRASNIVLFFVGKLESNRYSLESELTKKSEREI